MRNLESKSDFEDAKQAVRFALDSGNLNSALEKLEPLIPQFRKTGDTTLIELSNPLISRLSIPALAARWEALLFTRNELQALQELKGILQSALFVAERKSLLSPVINVFFYTSQLEAAQAFLHEIFATIEENDPAITQALVEKARLIFQRDPQEAFQLLERAREVAIVHKITNPEFWGDFHFRMGRVLELQAHFQKAADWHRKATDFYRQAGAKHNELRARYNAAAMDYDSGFADQALVQIEAIENEVGNNSLVSDDCLRLKLAHYINCGRLETAFEVFKQKKLCEKTEDNEAHQDILLLEKRALVEFARNKLDECIGSYRQLAWQYHSLQNKNSNLYTVYLDILSAHTKFRLTPRVLKLALKSGAFSETDRLDILNFYLELNLRAFFPASVEREIEAVRDDYAIDPVDLSACLNFLIGAHFFCEGKFKFAVEMLERALENSKHNKLFFYECRSLIWLGLMDLAAGQCDAALLKIETVEKRLSEFDYFEELELHRIVKGLAFWKTGRRDECMEVLSELPEQSVYRYFGKVLCPIYDSRIKFTGPSVTSFQRKFFDFILSALDLDALEKIMVKTDTNKDGVAHYASVLPRLSPKQYDVVIDERNRHVRILGKDIPLTDKPLLLSLFRFLLVNKGRIHTKEDLVTFVWHQKYNPLFHDTRVYTSIKRLRELVNDKSGNNLILSVANGYTILAGVRYAILETRHAGIELNTRQQWVIEYVRKNGVLDRHTVHTGLKISPTLAKMELRDMIGRGLLKMQGKGPKTTYVLAN